MSPAPDIATAERELNALLQAGRVIDAVERYYHDDVSMQENLAPPMVGKAANLEREKAFFGTSKINHLKLLGSAVAGDVSFSEWDIDIVLGNGYNVKMTQVAARRWKDGKVVHERFYYDPKGAQ
jgi:hypothetical protein